MLIRNSRVAAQVFREKMELAEVEEVWVLALSPLLKVLGERMLFRGTVDSCMVHPRDVFRFGLLKNAAYLMVGHNHPSGECLPSDEDYLWTKKLRSGSELLQIPLLDHVIVTEDSFFSFASEIWASRN